jgi:hypothetical protein
MREAPANRERPSAMGTGCWTGHHYCDGNKPAVGGAHGSMNEYVAGPHRIRAIDELNLAPVGLPLAKAQTDVVPRRPIWIFHSSRVDEPVRHLAKPKHMAVPGTPLTSHRSAALLLLAQSGTIRRRQRLG